MFGREDPDLGFGGSPVANCRVIKLHNKRYFSSRLYCAKYAGTEIHENCMARGILHEQNHKLEKLAVKKNVIEVEQQYCHPAKSMVRKKGG